MKKMTLLLIIVLIGGCTTYGTGPGNTVVKDIPPDSISNVRSTGPETNDLLSCADELARDLLSLPEVAAATPYCRMALRQVENHSRFRFDTDIIADQLRHLLIEYSGNRIRFVERSRGGDVAAFDPAVESERIMKREGLVDSGSFKARAGVDFFLKGDIRSHTVATGGGVDDAVFFYFRLVDTETSEIVWEHSYGPIRKVAEKSRAYRTAPRKY